MRLTRVLNGAERAKAPLLLLENPKLPRLRVFLNLKVMKN
ncbi:hypothetical protein US8_01791 [Bacillus altitudinis]|nr:hypothetical protein US8_01791 [Bacillus altitudinis]